MLRYAFISEIGDRTVNEDAVRVVSVANKHCFVVCDGLGGHDRGEVAAKLVCDTFAHALCFADGMEEFLLRAFDDAQQKVLETQKKHNGKSKMKTTAVVLATDEQTACVGHIGDSRFYGFPENGGYIRTRDHSVPQVLADSQTIEESDIRHHPSRNMLLKVIGERGDDAGADLLAPFPLDDYRAFLLCSDGFWELIREEKMISLLSQCSTPRQWLDKMLQEVKRNGAGRKMDNCSAIAVFCKP